LMLETAFGLKTEAQSVINAVEKTLKDGFRTIDIADADTAPEKVLKTDQMTAEVVKRIE